MARHRTFKPAMSRRGFLRTAFLTGSSAAAVPVLQACGGGGSGSPGSNSGTAGAGDSGTVGSPSTPTTNAGELAIPTGPLANIPPLGATNADGLRAPEGWTIRHIAHSGSPVAGANNTPVSAYTWHSFPDGGACYPKNDGGWIYTSNSEVIGAPQGGCGAIEFDMNGNPINAYSILQNTMQNCAGGATPWNTWLSGEEHGSGQIWECDPYSASQGIAKPTLGLFGHEAAAVDPINKMVYLTEDAGGQSRFYRWVPDESDWPEDADRAALENGTLQVLNIEGFEDGGYSDDPAPLRQLRTVSWKDAVNPDQPQGNVRNNLSDNGETAPGTRTPGGEGLWYYELPAAAQSAPSVSVHSTPVPTRGLIFFTTKTDNRVYALDIENQVIELIFDNEQIPENMTDVDNLTVSPAGDILVAEDLVGSRTNIRIIVVIPNEPAKVLLEVYHTASEICGPAFSPDGSRLYFSSQRGPATSGTTAAGSGSTIELIIPPEFRG